MVAKVCFPNFYLHLFIMIFLHSAHREWSSSLTGALSAVCLMLMPKLWFLENPGSSNHNASCKSSPSRSASWPSWPAYFFITPFTCFASKGAMHMICSFQTNGCGADYIAKGILKVCLEREKYLNRNQPSAISTFWISVLENFCGLILRKSYCQLTINN